MGQYMRQASFRSVISLWTSSVLGLYGYDPSGSTTEGTRSHNGMPVAIVYERFVRDIELVAFRILSELVSGGKRGRIDRDI